MSSNHFKQDLFTQFACVGKAMSNCSGQPNLDTLI